MIKKLRVKYYFWKMKVKNIIERVPFSPFRLGLSEKGYFGNLLWIGVKGNQKLKTYVKNMRQSLKEAGILFDDDKFIPHITLVRKAVCKKAYQVHLNKAEMTDNSPVYIVKMMFAGRVFWKSLLQNQIAYMIRF